MAGLVEKPFVFAQRFVDGYDFPSISTFIRRRWKTRVRVSGE